MLLLGKITGGIPGNPDRAEGYDPTIMNAFALDCQ
jgi:hypothetical protein